MSSRDTSPAGAYAARAAQFGERRDALGRRSRLLSNARVAAFAGAVVLGVSFELNGSTLLAIAAALTVIAFVVLIVLHQRTRRREHWFASLASLNEEGLERLARNWDRLPLRVPARPIADHDYAADLDLYGRASLSQILGPVATPFGSAQLDEWLLARAAPATVAERQDAVRELAPMHDLRDTLALHGRSARTVRLRDIERFLEWAESPARASKRASLRVLAWALPATTWALIVAHALGIITTSLWLVPLLISFVVYFTIGARVRRTFDAAFGREPLFTYYPDMIAALTHGSFASPLLTAIGQRLVQQDQSAHTRLGSLQRLMHLADLRSSSMHLPVFLLTMWDLHVVFAVERWQRISGVAVRGWLDALGEVEALSALATLAHDQPHWVFPELTQAGEPAFVADGLGHPLIPDGVRVHNDVQVGPPGTFLLVTGSNMSGKSTLLRSIGVNAVLAQAGAPVCARRLRMSPLEVCTSIRVQDSLARGVSYFMAELERLKQIVDTAHRTRDEGTATLLFLLDEILHGTNTAERRIAATRVIRHLVDSGAIGAATTHDLDLAAEPALMSAARLVHFTETFDDVDGESTLRFDYRLREGLATSTNALALMRIVGLPEA